MSKTTIARFKSNGDLLIAGKHINLPLTDTFGDKTSWETGVMDDVEVDDGSLRLEQVFGKALSFDGVDDFIAVNQGSLPKANDEKTIEFLCLGKNIANYFGAVATRVEHGGVNNNSNGYLFRVNGSAIAYNHTGKGDTLSSYNFDTYKWYHIAVTTGENGANVKHYVNGILQQLTTNTITTANNELSNGHTVIGRQANTYVDGCMDEVRLWNVARTQQQIADNMYRELTGDETGLVGYWKFNEGTGSTAYDSVGSNNGMIYGATWTDTPYTESGTWQSPAIPLKVITDALPSSVTVNATVPNGTFVKVYSGLSESDQTLPETWNKEWGGEPTPTPEEYFTFDSEEQAITGYNIAGGLDVVIPQEIGGVQVEKIRQTLSGTFSNKGITSVIFPEGLRWLESFLSGGAFVNNELTEIILPDSVEIVGLNTFSGNDIGYAILPANMTVNTYYLGTPHPNALGNHGLADYYNDTGKRAGEYTYDLTEETWSYMPIEPLPQTIISGNNYSNKYLYYKIDLSTNDTSITPTVELLKSEVDADVFRFYANGDLVTRGLDEYGAKTSITSNKRLILKGGLTKEHTF